MDKRGKIGAMADSLRRCAASDKLKGLVKVRGLTSVHDFILLLLILCIVLPLCMVVSKPSLSDYASVFTSDVFRSAMANTAVLCVLSASLSAAIGYFYAYAIAYSRVPFKRFFAAMPLVHLILPPSVSGLSFILLFGRNGFVTMTLLHLDVSLYGLPGTVVAQVLCFFPIAYVICLQRLRSINHSLENAACAMSDGYARVFLLTLRLSHSAILQSFLFVCVLSASDFGNPLILAGRFRVAAIEIYSALTGWIDVGKSACMGTVLLIPSLLLFILQSRLEAKGERRTSQIGKGSQSDLIAAPPAGLNHCASGFCMFMASCIAAQVVSVSLGAFQNVWGVDWSLTLKHMASIANAGLELRNSIVFSFFGAVAAVVVASVCAYSVFRVRHALSKVMHAVISLPAAVPGTLFGMAFLLLSANAGIRSSRLMISVAMFVGFVPFAYRIFSSRLLQISESLDDASSSCGASWRRTFIRVFIPLSGESVFSSLFYCFARGIGTVSAVIFLVSFDTPLASVRILSLTEQGFWGDAAALSLFLMVVIFLLLLLAYAAIRLFGRKDAGFEKGFIFL